MQANDIDVWLGLDVGKEPHHACALDSTGERIHDKPLKQDETQIRALFGRAHGTWSGAAGRRPAEHHRFAAPGGRPRHGVAVAYLPGGAMRKAAQLLPGDAKTDERDAYVIAFTALHMPETLRDCGSNDETLAALKIPSGYDEDLAWETTRHVNRLRSLLLQIHPAFERALKSDGITGDTVLAPLERYGGPAGMKRSGVSRVTKWAKDRKLRNSNAIVNDLSRTIGEQTVTVAGTAAAETVIPAIARQLIELKRQRRETATQAERPLEDHPLLTVLTSMPEIAAKTGSQIILAIEGDITRFKSTAHLAAYAGIAPVTRRSGTSVWGEHPARSGNKRLKDALWQSAFIAAFHDPDSRAYYQRKRTEGKRHNAAVTCLARRRCDVLYSMLKNGTLYQPKQTAAAKTA